MNSIQTCIAHLTPVKPRILAAICLVLAATAAHGSAAPGQLKLVVTDAKSGEPMPAQIRLTNRQQRVVRLPSLPRDGEWMIIDGEAVLKLPNGPYQFEVRRGLEYKRSYGHFMIDSGADDEHQVALPRFVDMRKEGWYSADLLVPFSQSLPLQTRASDLHFVDPVIADNRSRRDEALAALQRLIPRFESPHHLGLGAIMDRRKTSVSQLFNLRQAMSLPDRKAPLPTAYELVREAIGEAATNSEPDAAPAPHVHLGHVSHWDLPIWVALSPLHSVGLLHGGLLNGPSGSTSKNSAADFPRDKVVYPDPEGAARWSQHIYFQLLEAGLRISPAAGTGGQGGQPLGTNRVYVQCEDGYSQTAWWEGLRAGRVIVTNGPLLRVRASGEYPGHVYRASAGESVSLELIVQLSTPAKVQYLEVIQNGRSIQQVRLEDWVAKQGRLPNVEFQESGWFLVRAVVDETDKFYRAAITGPFYVEIDGQPRVSRQACGFFKDWIYQRARRVKLADPKLKRALLTQHRDARDFWQQRQDSATTD